MSRVIAKSGLGDSALNLADSRICLLNAGLAVKYPLNMLKRSCLDVNTGLT